MKRIILATILLIALATTAWAATIEVTQPVQVTTSTYYERGQAALYDGSDYWLFYGRSTTVMGNYDNGNPETHDYEVYYKTSSSVPALASATAAKVLGANNTNGYLGETGAAYFGGDVWAFASVDVGTSADIYGWWTNDGGSNWNEVGPIITGLSDGQAHHDEVAFGGEIWIVEGSGPFTTTHSSTPKAGGWSAPLKVDAALTGGLVHFFSEGSDLYLAINASSVNYIYKYNSGTVAWDKVDETIPPDKYDPTLFKVGTTYVFAQAPWISDGSPGGRQYLLAYSNSVLDGTFFDNGHKSVTAGGYGSNSWVDMWPIGFTDNGGTSYLFYSSERNPSDPTSEIDGNIWYLEVDWDVTGDHYTYIQEAIDGAATSDIVDVAAGTYSEGVVVNQALTLNGAKAGVDPRGGAWTGDITVVNPGTDGYGIDVQASNVTVSGFEITGGMYGIYIGSVDASNVTISYNDLHANDKYGLQAIGLGSTVSFVSVSTNYMHHNGRNGFKLVDATDCTVTANEFAHNGFGAAATKPEYKYGIFLEDERHNAAQYSPAIRNSFTGNSFHDNALGAINMEVMGNAVGAYWTSTEFLEDTVVEGNDFDGGSSVWAVNVSDDYNDDGSQDGFGPIAMVDAGGNWWDDAGGPYHATTNTGGLGCKISDDVDYSPWWGGNYVGDPHSSAWQWHVNTSNSSTIQEGIDEASAADIISVAAGTYAERLTISKALDLRGAQYGVDPTAGGARVTPANESIVDITGLSVTNPNVAVEIPSGIAGVSLAGFTLVGSPTFNYSDEAVIRSWDDDHTIEDNIMDGYICVLLKGGDNLSISRDRMVANKNGIVIQPYAANNVLIDGNTIAAGTSMASDPAGIYMTGSNTGVISDNRVIGIIGSDTRGKALTGSNLTNLTVSGNTFTGNGYDAVSFWGTTTFITISDNDLSNNGVTKAGCGVKIKGQDITISGNHITGNSDAGVMIDRHLIDTQRVTVFNNDLSGNTNYGLEVNTALVTETIDASGNWWGSNVATTVQAEANGGSGGDYTPWLDLGTDTDPGTFGFQGDFSVLYVDDDSPQSGATMRIQEAVDLVTASTVKVMDGTYGADVVTGRAVYITKDGLNLIGQSQSGTVIDGAVGGVGSSGSYWPTGIHVQADNVTLRDLTVQGFTGDQVSSGGYGVLFRDYGHDEPGEGFIYYTGGTAENVTSQDNYYPMYALVHHNLTVRNCLIQNNVGDGMFIARESDGAMITGNTVLSSGDHGIWVGNCWAGLGPSDNATITGNAVDGAREGGISFVGSDGATIEGNVITNAAGEGWSVGALSLKDGPSNVTARYNVIYGNDGTWGGYSGTGHGIGIDGTPSNIDLKWNSVYANAGDGCHNYSTVDVDATHCWWGDATGPGGVGPGSGDEVTAYVLYDPWIGKAGSENIVCVPDPEYLTAANPTKTITVDYLGGGGGLVYGYSIKFSWDGSKASTDPGKVLQGSLLSDMGTTYFFRNLSGTNEITVDCALSGDWPGVSGPGTLFTVEFTGLAVGTSPIDVTVIKVRDKANNPLSGFYEDDGLLVVDVSNPDVTNVLIENLTLAHTDDYIKNTDAARVTATVTDDDPSFNILDITADLTGLGSGAAVPPDTYVSGLATWTTALTGVTCTPANDVVTVTVTAMDGIGNTDSDSDGIIADNISPATIANLSAVQVKSGNDADGTTRITLTFAAPGDAYETEVYNAGFGDYPEYDDGTGSEPAGPAYPPAAPWAVTAVTATGQDDEPALRDFWYYVVFTKDIAYNVSLVSNKTTGTLNYHLGDVSDGATPGQGDNYVNSVDFSLMGTSYWKSDGDGGYLNYCDVGPTTDLSTDKLPTTDDKIDFEDLMMFAINFTTVTFTAGGDPEAMPAIERPALRLEWDEQGEDRRDVLVAHLMLEGNSRAVKGLHSEISYDGNSLELVGVTAGSLLAEQGAPVFTEHHNGAGLVQFDAAILGRKLTIRGSGEVAELRFQLIGTVERMPVLKSGNLRDRRNREIRWDIEPEVVDETAPASTTPRVLSLGSHPNPFSASTLIRLNLPSASRVSLSIYDVSGRLVRTLEDGVMSAGEHNVEWNGRSANGERVAAGVYIAIVKAEGRKVSQKLFVLP